jgi:hypothetical protein
MVQGIDTNDFAGVNYFAAVTDAGEIITVSPAFAALTI